ncbi:nucleoside-diphosphate-sugar epimerase [Terriglobus roseus DSM 18391]|uniref:Nucleoside-diphosphate-sugar epimerase n=1 Tax=Terriglobus roseus (strain DSM 18391 / NRRL B-41598 / KBS 63) TaxID=926566 RepID=I3ZML3_TERRK|nr:SDR family oxidoreductase [Terriglobus roseus]AFL90481.1 nucleoside-diphosphate-sugar epimerase [Terriglobus roseus DSM 18391]
MKTVLVTGAAGFIGSHLVDALVARGERVRGLDNFATGRASNLAHVRDQIDFTEASLLDREPLARACEGVDVIFHQAALPSVPRSVQDPRTSHIANIEGTFELLEAARAAGVKRVVYAASSSAYGNQPGFPRVETMVPMPIAPYPVQKLAGEFYMKSYWQVYGIETVCLRYFNIFGPRQVPDSPYSGVMAKFILQLQQGERPMIFGDGEQGRDFTYIANAIHANLLASEAPAADVAGRVFNIATGERHTLNETYDVIASLLNTTIRPQYGPDRAGDVKNSEASIAAAQEAFGYNPTVNFEEGLQRTVDWYREEFEKSQS